MSDVIPPELWTEILLRLPVRPLLTLKCVSKFFLSLIQNPNFGRLHLSRFNNCYSESEDSYLFLLERTGDSRFGLCRGNTSTKTLEFEVSRDIYDGSGGYVDGFFWLYRFLYPSNYSYLCNPSLRRSILIPPSPYAMKIGPTDAGFGYDILTDDYKVVVIRLPIPIYDPTSLKSRDPTTPCILVEIYSLRMGSWRSVEADVIFLQLAFRRNVYANGAVHWMARDYLIMPPHDAEPDYSHVVSFDLGHEVLSFRELPEVKERAVKLPLSLHGLLALFYVSISHIYVWVMTENGWTNESTIESSHEFYQYLYQCNRTSFNNAVFSEKTDELLITSDTEGVISYNVKTKQHKTSHKGVSRVGVYVENLLWREFLPPRSHG